MDVIMSAPQATSRFFKYADTTHPISGTRAVRFLHPFMNRGHSPMKGSKIPAMAARPATPNAGKTPDDALGRPPLAPDSIAPAD